MILEANRLKSFKTWPFNDGVCIKETVAQAGLYHCNIEEEPDSVRCFCCFKVLEGWEQNDDPWLEHKRNNNGCYFVKLGKTEKELTVAEFVKIVEEREVNLMNKRIRIRERECESLLDHYGLTMNEDSDAHDQSAD